MSLTRAVSLHSPILGATISGAHRGSPASRGPAATDGALSTFGQISEELLCRGYRVRFHLQGRSMQPTIRDRDFLVVEGTRPDWVTVGDILLVRSVTRPIASRVADISTSEQGTRRFVLRGDASRTEAEPVSFDRVIGRVVAVERNGRTIQVGTRGARWAWSCRAHVRYLMRWAAAARSLFEDVSRVSICYVHDWSRDRRGMRGRARSW